MALNFLLLARRGEDHNSYEEYIYELVVSYQSGELLLHQFLFGYMQSLLSCQLSHFHGSLHEQEPNKRTQIYADRRSETTTLEPSEPKDGTSYSLVIQTLQGALRI